MKITILTSRYPSNNNPYNHMFVHMRSLEMKKKGNDISVFVPSKITKKYVHEGIDVFMMPSKDIIKKINSKGILYLHLLNIYPFSKDNGWVIYKYLLKNNSTFAMYVHGSEVQKYGSRMFEFNYKISDFLKWFKKDVLVIPKMKRFVKNVKNRKQVTFIYPSLWMKKEMEINLNLQIDNYHVIPNGIDTKLFKFHDLYKNKYKLVTLRPLSSKKYAVDIAINIMKFLPQPYTLEIFGKGMYEKTYKNQIKQLGLEKRIVIKNSFIERNNLNAFFSNYGVFLSPTRMDAQGVTMCEAMASGLLTVSNKNTAIPEFISDNKNGILGIEPKEIAEKIITITNDKALFEQITKNGRESMSEIDIEKTIKKELNVLYQINH